MRLFSFGIESRSRSLLCCLSVHCECLLSPTAFYPHVPSSKGWVLHLWWREVGPARQGSCVGYSGAAREKSPRISHGMVQTRFVCIAPWCTMPIRCACGVRPRRDLSCRTPACPAFRLSCSGANLAKRKMRLIGKSVAAGAGPHLSPAWRAKARAKAAERGTRDATDNEEPDGEPLAGEDAAKDVGALLRSTHTEELLVELFGQPAYFTLLALAYTWRPRPIVLAPSFSPSLDAMPGARGG